MQNMSHGNKELIKRPKEVISEFNVNIHVSVSKSVHKHKVFFYCLNKF